MANEVAIIEPIQPPDQQRPARMPCLPAWLGTQIAALRDDQQPDPETRRYRLVPTLPSTMIPNETQRQMIGRHAQQLSRLLEQTPLNLEECERATLVLLTKMMLGPLAAPKASELGSEAATEAYMMALEDMPSWSVDEAIRGWYRGSSQRIGSEPHDFNWRPKPAMLRALAFIEMGRVKSRVGNLRRLLSAEVRIEYTDEERARMRSKLQAMGLGLDEPKPKADA